MCSFKLLKELTKKENLSEVILALLSKSSHLDESTCAKNSGYFIKLEEDEQRTLVKVSQKIEDNKTVLNRNPKWKANKLYIEFMQKLKIKYFESLNYLIVILEKLKESPFVSSNILNQLGMETKNIIDNLYNMLILLYLCFVIINQISIYILQSDPSEQQIKKIEKNYENKLILNFN